MTYKHLTLFSAFLFSVSVFGQKVSCKPVITEPFKDNVTGSTLMFAQDDKKGGSLVLRSLEGGLVPLPAGFVAERYDAALNRTAQFVYQEKSTFVLGMNVYNDTVSIIELAIDKKTKQSTVNILRSGIDNFVFTRKELIAPSFVNASVSTSLSGSFELGCKIINNPSNSSFAMVFNSRGNSKNKVVVFSHTGKQNFSFDFDIDEATYNDIQNSAEISEDGTAVVLLTRKKNSKTKNKDEGGKYSYLLSKVTAQGYKELPISVGEYYIPNLKAITGKGNIIVAGFYGNKNDRHTAGTCLFEVSADSMKLNKQQFTPFTQEFMVEKFGHERTKEIDYVSVKNLQVLPGGDIYFDGEETRKQRLVPGSGGLAGNPLKDIRQMSADEYRYYFEDVVCVRMHPDGSVAWVKNIQKNQAGDNTYAEMSYTSTVTNDNVYLFVNYRGKGYGHKETFGLGDGNINIINIDPNGNVTGNRIFEDRTDVTFMTYGGITAPGAVYFFGRTGKKKQLLKVGL